MTDAEHLASRLTTEVMCDWPNGELFAFRDEPGEHDPCYVVMPGGAMLPLNHHAAPNVDISRAKFIVKACNAALSPPEAVGEAVERWADIQNSPAAIVKCGERWRTVAALIGCELYGFNDGCSASFTTPDGNVIEIGQKFRARIAALASMPDDTALLREAAQSMVVAWAASDADAMECAEANLRAALAGDQLPYSIDAKLGRAG